MSAMANWPPDYSHLETVHVYAYLDAGGQILYIGQSRDLRSRHLAHSEKSPWFPLVADFALITRHHNRDHARDAEADAIRTYRPLFNVQHNRNTAA